MSHLGYEHLLSAAKALDLAHTWIGNQLAADAKGRKETANITAK
jgi:hypothetical protein